MKPYPAYKDSGVPWIGEVPEHWCYAKLRWISKIYAGGTPSKDKPEYWANGTIPWLSSGEVNQGYITRPTTYISDEGFRNSSARWIPKDALVIALAGQGKTKGIVAQLGIRTTCNQSLAAIVPQRLFPRYLYYWLDSNYKNIRGLVGDEQRDGLNLDIIGSIPVPMLSADEQCAIATYLDRKTAQIDALIANKRRRLDLLAEERTARISHAVTKGLDPTAPLKDSGIEWIGEIPARWEIKRLKWVIREKLKYGANETTDLTDSTLPRYIRITDFGEDGNLREDTFKSLEWEIAKDYLLEEGDILFARSGATVGKTFQFRDYKGTACFAGYLIKANPNEMTMLSDFLYYYTKSNAYENWRDSIFIQATIQNIGADKYQNLEVPVPPLPEQRAIAAYLDEKTAQIDRATAHTEHQIALLQEYRTALISAAVTGKIDVRDARLSQPSTEAGSV